MSRKKQKTRVQPRKRM